MGQFHISHNGDQLGPYGLEEILEKVKSSELTLMDFIYDESQSDWVLLMEYPPLAEKLKDFKPKAPPKTKTTQQKVVPEADIQAKASDKTGHSNEEHMVTEWYVLKGENKFGPFAFTDVVKMLQQKVVFEFDFAWHPGLSTWKRVAELEAFHPENIEKLKSTLMPEIEDVFYRRRHRRTNFGATVLVHDNNKVWKGQGVEISAGGAGVIMENALITPGQKLHLHFKPCDGVPPFNAICEVVSKRYVDGLKDRNAPVRYGLKFTEINPQAQKVLQNFSKGGSQAA